MQLAEANMADVVNYMNQMLEIKKSCWPECSYPYRCIEDFVLRHGEAFRTLGETPPLHMGQVKMCFDNAYRMARYKRDLTYVEGFATGVIPVLHAWVVDKEGVIYDPTWPDRITNRAYFGVRFPFEFVRDFRKRYKTCSMIDVFHARWPLLSGAEKIPA